MEDFLSSFIDDITDKTKITNDNQDIIKYQQNSREIFIKELKDKKFTLDIENLGISETLKTLLSNFPHEQVLKSIEQELIKVKKQADVEKPELRNKKLKWDEEISLAFGNGEENRIPPNNNESNTSNNNNILSSLSLSLLEKAHQNTLTELLIELKFII